MDKIDEENTISKSDMLNHSKQELVQADAKLGWLLAVHVLIVTTMVTLGCELQDKWMIIGGVMIVPIISILIILYGLLPRNIPGGKNGLNPFNYKVMKTENLSVGTNYDITTSVNLFLSRKKYIAARNSFWYIAIMKWLFISCRKKIIKK